MRFKFLLIVTIIGLWVTSCNPDDITDNPDVLLSFSTDTLTFDTVFTTIGSTTEFFRIYNNENKAVNVSSIQLGGGSNSMFRINVNGTPGSLAENVEIGANDSLYVFVEVTVDPNNDNLPFLVTDSILFNTNGNEQMIKLVAYGQNAVYLSNVAICDEIFTNEKPYLLYNTVLVDSACTLTLKEGVRMYMHPFSNLIVNGTLNVEGTKDSMVTFQGDRLEDYFDDLPAQWGGIYMLRGSNANIEYADINESTDGIVVGFDNDIIADENPQLIIKNSIIRNCINRNILGLRSVIKAENCQFTNSGLYNIELALGGLYDFNHCTIVNYGGGAISHRDPILRMANYAIVANTPFVADDITVNFVNSIIHGSEDEEIFLDTLSVEEGATEIDYVFNHCILKTERDISEDAHYTNCITNPMVSDTLFVDRYDDDFHLNSNSPAIDAGIVTSLVVDFDGVIRDANPDMGCYEFQ